MQHPLYKVGHRFGLWEGVFNVIAIEIVLVVVLLIGWGIGRQAKAAELRPVDVALVLAVDVSGSISAESWALQRDGIADAIGSPAFAETLAQGQIGRVAIAVMQWGSSASLSLPWRVLESAGDASALAAELRGVVRAESGGTFMGMAVRAAGEALAPWAEAATRRVIDVSGDGASNGGLELGPERLAVLAEGITINGLPIMSTVEPLVDHWYEQNVIGGPGAFLIVAAGYGDFAEAFRRKLTQEIAEAPPSIAQEAAD